MCDCVVNVNVFRFSGDKSLCEFLENCFNKNMKTFTYYHPRYFFYYFYSKAVKEGLSCKIKIKENLEEKLSKDLDGLPLILTFTSSTILGLEANKIRPIYGKVQKLLMEDYGSPTYTDYTFISRTLPTVILLEGLLNYDKEYR